MRLTDDSKKHDCGVYVCVREECPHCQPSPSDICEWLRTAEQQHLRERPLNLVAESLPQRATKGYRGAAMYKATMRMILASDDFQRNALGVILPSRFVIDPEKY